MIREYDIVTLVQPMPEKNIPVGSRGAVLVVYQRDPGVYEVEFVSTAGASFGTVTVSEGFIRKAASNSDD
jgi:hypothetical protein